MCNKYELLAAHYPFKGYYEKSFQCNTLLMALTYFLEYKRQGYEIINLNYRNFKEQFTSTWSED